VDQLFECQRKSRFETKNPEGRAIELHIFYRRLVRRVVGGDGIHGAVGESCEQRFAVLPRCQRRIHLEPRIVAHVFVDQREMMRRDFACDAQPA